MLDRVEDAAGSELRPEEISTADDSKLEAHVKMCRSCMKLAEEKLGIMLDFTLVRPKPKTEPDHRFPAVQSGDLLNAKLDICTASHRLRPLYACPAHMLSTFTDVPLSGRRWMSSQDIDAVLQARSSLKPLATVQAVLRATKKKSLARQLLEHEAATYAAVDLLFASDDCTAAFSAVEIDADNPREDHLCLLKLDGKLLEMCFRLELDLCLAAAMSKLKAVEEL